MRQGNKKNKGVHEGRVCKCTGRKLGMKWSRNEVTRSGEGKGKGRGACGVRCLQGKDPRLFSPL